ncbi:Hypothetical predicted protein [Cloeon dipterum]|nr:Hypothetical predicted protein [Cloeon dipterum]
MFIKLGSQNLERISNDSPSSDPFLEAIALARAKLKKAGKAEFNFCLESILSRKGNNLNTLEMREIIRILLNSKTKDINFTLIMEALHLEDPGDHQFDLMVLQKISSIATSISKFTYCIVGEENLFPHTKIKKATREFLTELCKMKTLKVFEVNILCFTITNLLGICKNLQNLKFLNIFLTCDEKLKSRTRKKLKKLTLEKCKEFRFSSVWCKDHNNEELQTNLTRYCVQHVPNLEGIGNYDCFTDMTNEIINYKGIYSNLKRIDISVDSESKNISLIKFHKVEHLKLANFQLFSLLNWLGTKMLKNTTSLELIHPLHPAHWEQLMMRCGKNLNALIIELPTSNIGDVRLALIDAECPNLKVLKLRQIDRLSADATWSLCKFKKLVELQLQVK